VIVATALTTLLIGGATYVFSPLGDGDSDLSAQAVGSPHSTGPAPQSTSPTTSAPIRTKAPPAPTVAPDRTESRSVQSSPTTSAVAVRRSGLIEGPGGRCLDVVGGQAEDGTAVQIFRCNGSSAQTWSVMKDGTLRALDKCLQAVDIGARHPRAQIKDCTGRANQQWVVSSGVIVNPGSAECLDVVGGRSQPRTPVITADCGGGPRQGWWLES
jgi:hypothetical protein